MTDALVEAVARAAWLAYQGLPNKRPEPEYEGDDEPERWDSAMRDWKEWPAVCTHIGADGFRRCAAAALQAIEAAGYRVVPVEATREMVSAGCGAIEDIDQENVDENDVRFWGQPWRPCAIGAWSAMLSAAPRVR